MADSSNFLDKIKMWMKLHKQCAEQFNRLAHELEETTKSANMTKVAGSLTSLLGATAMTVTGLMNLAGYSLPLAEPAAGISLVTSISSEIAIANKSDYAMKEAKKIIEELKKLDKEIQDFMKTLKPGAGEGQPSGSCDDDCDANIMEQLLRSEAKRQGLKLSHSVNLHRMCRLTKVNFYEMITANNTLLEGSTVALLECMISVVKAGAEKVAEYVGRREKSKAAGYAAEGAFELFSTIPDLLSDYQNKNNCETEASKTMRKNAEAVYIVVKEMDEDLKKIREAVQKLNQIKVIIKKKNRSSDEQNKLIQFVIENTQHELIQRWLENESKFFKLIDLCNFIQEEVDKEEEKKKKRRKNRKKIHLIFVAHGSITNEMIPARCLLSLPSITDVILYSPCNCRLSVNAAYGIATGSIEPHHRMFMCAGPENLNSDRQPSPLPNHWNSMKDAGVNPVPIIMVNPVKKTGDPAFSAFLSLEAKFDQPGEDRYVIRYLAHDIGRVPFFVITLALSVVLLFSEYEATVHLVA